MGISWDHNISQQSFMPTTKLENKANIYSLTVDLTAPGQSTVQVNILFKALLSVPSIDEASNLTSLKEALENDEKIKPLLENMKKKNSALLQKFTDPQFNWKQQHANLTEDDDLQRRDIVDTIGKIATILAEREGIPTEGPGFIKYGTEGKTSDIDLSVNKINSQNEYADNAIQGHKTAMASLIWRALFNGTSLDQADTEFYPPHAATYATTSFKTPEANALLARASFTAQFLQMQQNLSPKAYEKYTVNLKKHLTENGLKVHLGALQDAQKDVAALQNQVEQLKANGMSKTSTDSALSSQISKEMQKTGNEIAKLKQELSQIDKKIQLYEQLKIRLSKEMNAPEQDEHLSQQRMNEMKNFERVISKLTAEKQEKAAACEKSMAYFLIQNNLRARFLPEGYITMEAFAVVCNNFGGQMHVNEQLALEKKLAKGDIQNAPKLQYRANTPRELIESIVENTAYFMHRKELIDASKYATRVYDSTLKYLEPLSDDTTVITPQGEKKVSELKALCKKRLDSMNTLEGLKRHRWTNMTFIKETIQLSKQEVFKGITPEKRLETLEKTTKTLNKVLHQAHLFFDESRLGKEKVELPQKRYEKFLNIYKKEMGKAAPQEFCELASRIARVDGIASKNFIEQEKTKFTAYADQEVAILKKEFHVQESSEFEERNAVLGNIRQELLDLCCVVQTFGLKGGSFKSPYTPKQDERSLRLESLLADTCASNRVQNQEAAAAA